MVNSDIHITHEDYGNAGRYLASVTGIEGQAEVAYHLARLVALAQALGDQHQSVAFFVAGCPCALLGRMVILTRPLPAPPLSTWLVFML